MANTEYYKQDKIEMRFLKFTAQQIKFRLTDTNNKMLSDFLVNASDRQYQFWERNSLSIDLWTKEVLFKNLFTFIIIL